MTSDPATLIHNLRNLHAAGVLDNDEYAAKLKKLRASIIDPAQAAGIDAAIAVLEAVPQRSVTNVQGDIHAPVLSGTFLGHVYLDGRRAEQAAQLLHDYLEQLCVRCGELRLQALHQQVRYDDRYAIGLAAVYTQLAVEGEVVRETYAGATLALFDLNAFLKIHHNANLLPWQQRTRFSRPALDSDYQRGTLQGQHRPNDVVLVALDQIKPEQLLRDIQAAGQVTWLGPRLVTDAIADTRTLVLLGEPGSGKSTALRYLALTLAEAALNKTIILADRLAGWNRLGDQGHLLPLFLPLLPFARKLATNKLMVGTADELWEHIADTLEPGDVHTGLAEAVHAELSDGRVILLLDGLDEVVGDESRQKVVQVVAQFAKEHPRCRVVVSCRIRAYEGEQNRSWRLADWPTATLQSWAIAQQQYFIAAWYQAAVQANSLPEAQRESRVATLQRAVAASPDLQRLAVSPLLLTVMALVHLNDGRLPEDRVTLYSRCIDILLAQWEQRGKDQSDYGPLMEYIGLPDRDIQRLRPLLTRAAYEAQLAATPENPGALGRASLERMVMDYLKRLDHPNAYDGALRLLEYTDRRAGLLQAATVGDTYVFPHLTFQEYLAGLELTSGVGVVKRILEHHYNDRWRMPILLGVGDHVSGGKLEMPFQLLSELLYAEGRNEMQAQRDAIFACELAFDVGWDRLEPGGNSFKKLRRDMSNTLALVIEGTVLPAAERVRVGVLLGALGDLRPGVCDLQQIPFVAFAGGPFAIGNPPEQSESDDEQNSEVIDLAAFELARYPVTNAHYRLFIEAGGYNADAPWWEAAGRAWLHSESRSQPDHWHDARLGIMRPNQPLVGVSWYEAMAFCHWLTQTLNDGWIYSLPSELEWEYAARGTERRTYPWGSNQEPTAEHANYDEQHNGTSTVGCFAPGATPQGLLDMAGNVWEWTRSDYRPYPYNPGDGREDGSEPARKRFTLRGGGWVNPSPYLRASCRLFDTPITHSFNVGMRLVRHKR